tara:strand:+ start:1133 stop:1330 length:198 start_codon:yes stop_codon:yes gene_type:complete
MSEKMQAALEHTLKTMRDLKEAAARIEQLEAALAMFVCDCTVSERCPVPDNCRNFKARRMLEERT